MGSQAHYVGHTYALVLRPSDDGWRCQFVHKGVSDVHSVWEEWIMPPCDGPFDARSIASEIWAAATELLEKHMHLT